MYRNISRMQSLYGEHHFGFVPKTYILPEEYNSLEYEMEHKGGTWIVKPSASSQGKGIFITKRISDVSFT